MIAQDHQWIFATEEHMVQEGMLHVAFPGGLPVLLTKKNGKLFAISNKCAHMGCTLSKGTLNGYILKCPCHDWIFDLRTGEFVVSPEIKIPIYETKVEDSKIFVRI